MDMGVLSLAAVSTGFVHTLLGPDHYVPFVAMSRVGKWSLRKTVAITLLCGFGHVSGSIVLGLIGVCMGLVVLRLEAIESVRGNLAGWLLLLFGAAYTVWGLWHAFSRKPHQHLTIGTGGVSLWRHGHESSPRTAAEPEQQPAGRANAMTPWVLMVIFVLGPCEPLIPLLMYPAAKANPWALLSVTLLFAAATLATMTAMVLLMHAGFRSLSLGRLHRYGHALAGLAVFASGLAIALGL
jgi:hypothetical protein